MASWVRTPPWQNVGSFLNIIYLAFLKHKYPFTGIVILHITYLDKDNSVIEVHYTDIKITTHCAKVGFEPMMSRLLVSSTSQYIITLPDCIHTVGARDWA